MRSYSTKLFAVKTFANCPETVKFAKLFTCERFPLYGRMNEANTFISAEPFCGTLLLVSVSGIPCVECKVIMYIVHGQDRKSLDTEVIRGNGVQMYDKNAEDFQQPSV